MKYAIRIENTGPIAEGRGPGIIQDGVDRFITEVLTLLEGYIEAHTPQGVFGEQGGLASTIHGEPIALGTPLAMGIVGHQSPYGDVVEMGRRPGPISREGMEGLRRWVEVKLGVSGKEADRVAFLVGRKIRQKGFAGAHMFELGLYMNEDRIAAIAESCGINIATNLNGN